MSIRAIIFDFDGVIAESMDIKTQAFVHLFKEYPKEVVKKIVEFHLNNGGLSRYKKFRIIYRDFLNKRLTKKEEKRLAREFSKFCYDKMINCSFVKGAEDFLEKNYKKYMFFIASGTPQGEIDSIVRDRGLNKYFKEVWGSPKSKGEISRMILDKYNLKREEVVFVGDAPTDYRGAEEAGIKFIARIPPNKHNPFGSGNYKIKYKIEELVKLDKTLKMIDNLESKQVEVEFYEKSNKQ